MTGPLSVAFISGVSAILGSVLTILLTPRLQHHFWKHQRRAELRLSVIDAVNQLAAEFITGYTPDTYPSKDFLERLLVCTSRVKALFSDASYKEFAKVDKMIASNLDSKGKERILDFFHARDAALLALYKEVGVL